MWRSRARALFLSRFSIPRSVPPPPPRPSRPTPTLVTRVPLPPLPRHLPSRFFSSPNPTPDASAAADSFPKAAAFSPTEASPYASSTKAGEDDLSSTPGQPGDAAAAGTSASPVSDDEVARVRAVVRAAPDDKVASALAGVAVDFSEPLLAAVLLAADRWSGKKLVSLFDYAAKNNPAARSLPNLEILVSKVAGSYGIDRMDAYWLWNSVKGIGSVPGSSLSTPLLNGMIAIFCKLGEPKAAVEVFAKFGEFGGTPDGDTYFLAIEAARKKSMSRAAFEACEKMMGSGCLPNDGEKIGRIVVFLCERNKAETAHSLYLAAKEKKIQIPKSALDSLVGTMARDNGTVATAGMLLQEYQGESLRCAGKSLAAVVRGLCMANKAEHAKHLLMRMVVQIEEYQGESLTDAGEAFAAVIHALRRKRRTKTLLMDRDCFPTNGEKIGRILVFLCEQKNAKTAHSLSLYLAAKEMKIQIPKSALDSLVCALARHDETVATAWMLLEEYQGELLKQAGKSFAAVVHGLCRANRAVDAKSLLMRMVVQLEGYQGESLKDAGGAFSAVIDALCRDRRLKDAKTLLMRMVDVGPAPDKAVFDLVITALSEQREMEGARGLMEVMESQGISPDLYTYSVLMSGYTKGGMTDEAHALLREAQKFITPTASTWRNLISLKRLL